MKKECIKQKHMKKWKSLSVLLFSLVWLLSGCTPQQRTIVLPEIEHQKFEILGTSSGDFVVKKIYTYDYETVGIMGDQQSAFLEGCGEHQLRILAQEISEDHNFLESREVDYRYGFYDEIGSFDINDIYPYNPVLPSPDGKKALVYGILEFWNMPYVWLYDFEDQTKELLYLGVGMTDQGSPSDLHGSWSPSGQYVTYDVMGKTGGDKNIVYIFDTWAEQSEVTSVELESYILEDLQNFAGFTKDIRLRQADQVVYCPLLGEQFLDGRLLDGITGEPEVFLITTYEEGYLSGLYVYIESNEHAKGLGGEVETVNSSEGNFIFTGYYPLPWLEYEVDVEKKLIYHAIQDQKKIISTNYVPEDRRNGGIYEIDSDAVAFHFLDEEGFLAVQTSNPDEVEKYRNEEVFSPFLSRLDVQQRKAIRSLDLYWYTERAPESGEIYRTIDDRKLLYKDVKNLVAMEYDPDTNRILLETVPDMNNLQHRQCIVLEF